MKNILFIRKSNPQVGGVEKQMLRIALWLRDNSLAKSMLATDDAESNLSKLFQKNGFEIKILQLSGNKNLLNSYSQLRDIISANDVHIIQAHMFRESLICRMVKFFNPHVVHVFRVETYIDCSYISKFHKWLYHRIAFLTRNLVDYYFANGNLVGRELISGSGVDASKIEIVFNGVEPFGVPDFSEIEFDTDGFLHMAMVANFVRGKGHELLFKTINNLNNKNVNVVVHLFGDSMEKSEIGVKSYKDELDEEISKLGVQRNIIFEGFSNNLFNDLKNIKIVILPSFSEGTPNSLLEAMSVGKLVVASNVGEIPFMIENKVSGFVHQSGNDNELESIIEYVYKHPLQVNEIRKNGFDRWSKLFSLKSMMQPISKIFSDER